MSEKKIEKLNKVLNELPVNTTLKWFVNKSSIHGTIEAGQVLVHIPELAQEVGSEVIWSIDSDKESRGWVFGDHKPNLTIYLPVTRRLTIKDGKAEIVKLSNTYQMGESGTPVWSVDEINSILGSWVYDIINRSDLVFEYGA